MPEISADIVPSRFSVLSWMIFCTVHRHKDSHSCTRRVSPDFFWEIQNLSRHLCCLLTSLDVPDTVKLCQGCDQTHSQDSSVMFSRKISCVCYSWSDQCVVKKCCDVRYSLLLSETLTGAVTRSHLQQLSFDLIILPWHYVICLTQPVSSDVSSLPSSSSLLRTQHNAV